MIVPDAQDPIDQQFYYLAAQMMVGVEIAPAHPVSLAHVAKHRVSAESKCARLRRELLDCRQQAA